MDKYSELPVNIGGVEYTIASDDSYLKQIRYGFEPEMVKLFRVLASDSETTLDIGANIGCTAILFSELSSRVYAFEPSPTTFAFLEKNLASSEAENVFAHNLGLGEEAIESTLTYAPDNRSGGFVSNQIKVEAGHRIEKISIRLLDDVAESFNIKAIDFIKIDVEGFEGAVLRGARQTLMANKPVVVLELNHWCLNAFQRTSIPDFFDLLRSIFPIVLAVDGSFYLDIHDESQSYNVMYQHILNGRFPNIVAAFDEPQLGQFRSLYEHDFDAKKAKRSDNFQRISNLLRYAAKRSLWWRWQ